MAVRSIAVSIFMAALCLPAAGAEWRAIDPQQLALKASQSDPQADAEALFRDIRLLNEVATFGYPQNVITEYIRMKIFTDRGREKFGSVQIPYWGKNIVSGVEGRTIHPDGSSVDLKRDAVFEKVIEKKGSKFKVISFALPAIEPGSIIEYRWKKNVGEFLSRYIPIEVQSEFPVDEVTLHIKPAANGNLGLPDMRYMPFACKPEKNPNAEAGGFVGLTLRNVPAFREEPYMPPDLSAKQWILIYYEENDNTGKEKYWTALGREIYGEYNQKIKVNGEVKDIAREVITGANTDEEKLGRLVDYCRKSLKDIHGDQITTEEREAVKKQNFSTIDTLRRKEGTATDITLAFAALATAAGFEARIAELADRGTFLFYPVFQSRFFLDHFEVAVNVNNNWKFYDVTDRDVAAGELPWQEQGVFALVADSKGSEFVKTPLLSSKDSQVQRIGELKISADGTLEGDLRELFFGNKAVEWRLQHGKTNAAEREEALRNEIKNRFPEFELSAVSYSVPADLHLPIGLRFHLVVPNYAQRTGKRLFVMPAFFAAGYGSPFTDSARTQPIYFQYPWSENDSIEIRFPDGFELDHADAPGGVKFDPIGQYAVQISVGKGKIAYRRQLTFGNDTLLLFDPKAYPTLKQIFDRIHQADNHMLTLKADAPAAAGQ